MLSDMVGGGGNWAAHARFMSKATIQGYRPRILPNCCCGGLVRGLEPKATTQGRGSIPSCKPTTQACCPRPGPRLLRRPIAEAPKATDQGPRPMASHNRVLILASPFDSYGMCSWRQVSSKKQKHTGKNRQNKTTCLQATTALKCC